MNIHLIKEKHESAALPADREFFLTQRADSLDIARSKLRAFERLRDPNNLSAENKLEVLAFWAQGLQLPIPPLRAPLSNVGGERKGVFMKR